MAYNAKGEWVDDPNSKSFGQTFFPNAANAWNAGEGLADASFQRGDTVEGWGRQAARVGGTLAGLSGRAGRGMTTHRYVRGIRLGARASSGDL